MFLLPATAQAVQDRVSATEKGSLVILSKIEIRWADAAPFDLIQDTFISLTNDNNKDVRVQMYFVNGDAPLDADPVTGERAHPGWNWYDNQITLTGNQPACWSAATGQGTFALSPFGVLDPGTPPGRPAMDGTDDRVLRGFMYGFAVNNDGEEIRWNHLKAEGTIVDYANGAAWEYNSWNHQVVSGVAEGQPGDANPGCLNLDGTEYSPAFDQLLLNFVATDSDVFSGDNNQVVAELDVTLHPESADLRQETDGPITTKASYLVWNENETEFSGMHRCITCWDQQVGTLYAEFGVPNHFLLANIQTDCGKARIDGLQSSLCDFDSKRDDGPIGSNPEDVVSEAAALIGVAARFLDIDGGAATAKTGYNLVGAGTEAAVIKFDPSGSSQEAGGMPESADAVLNWIEGQAGINTKAARKARLRK
jgi:hypothetical protein